MLHTCRHEAVRLARRNLRARVRACRQPQEARCRRQGLRPETGRPPRRRCRGRRVDPHRMVAPRACPQRGGFRVPRGDLPDPGVLWKHHATPAQSWRRPALVVRVRTDPDTRAYIARRRAEGCNTKEIMWCLKRYVTRQVFRKRHCRIVSSGCLTDIEVPYVKQLRVFDWCVVAD